MTKVYHIIKTVIIVSFLCAVFVSNLFPQSKLKSRITGKVTDAATGEPIENVNLFLANTTLGSTTGKDGSYLIRNIPTGTFDLVVSHISYEFHTVRIKLLTPDSLTYNFSLTQRTIKGEQIGVTATIPKDWKKDLKKFTKLFIGKSKNAKKTKILNPEVINFKTDPETGTFTAATDSIIRVENRSLGYRVSIILRSFEYNKLNDKLKFVLYPRFVILNHKSPKELEHWVANRKSTYTGSFRHFMKSLMKGRLNEEKFVLSYASKPKKLGLVQIDPAKEELLESNVFGVSKFIPGGIINVHHKNKGNSWFSVETHRTLIDLEGNYSPADGIRKWGAWTKERIADLLPLEYEPQNDIPVSAVPFYSAITSAVDTLEKLIKSGKHYEADGELFVRALDELAFKNSNYNRVIKQLHKDIIDIMDKEEEKQWKKLKTNQEKAEFLRRFWMYRDLSFSTKTNERLEEHYKRLQFARTVYTSANASGYDDRGRIYIKYGEPDAKQIDNMPTYKKIDEAGKLTMAAGRSLETWVYRIDATQIIYNFVDKIWGFALAYTVDDIIPTISEDWERALIIEKILERRIDLDVRFSSAYFGESISFNEILREQFVEQRKIPVAISSQFENITELNFSFQPALFENNSDEHMLVMAYGFREDDINFSEPNPEKQAQVEIITVLRAPSLFDIATFESSLPIIKSTFDKNGELIHQLQTPVAYNSFYILADVSNPAGHQKGLKDYSIRKPAISSRQLHLSSVIFAKEIFSFAKASKDSSLLIRNDLAIKMYPFMELRKSDPIFLYFEIYGLRQAGSGKTKFDIEYIVEPQKSKNLASYLSKLNPFKKTPGKISISYSQEGNKTNDYFSVQMDLSQLRPGNYDLIARVNDTISSEKKETKISFVLK